MSALTSPTLPVPQDITTITPAQLTSLVTSGQGKGKGRAADVDVDMYDEGQTKKEKEGRGVIVLGQGSYLSTVQTFKNIAPIVDAALVDMDGSGQVSLLPRVFLQLINLPEASDNHLFWRTEYGVFEYCQEWG